MYEESVFGKFDLRKQTPSSNTQSSQLTLRGLQERYVKFGEKKKRLLLKTSWGSDMTEIFLLVAGFCYLIYIVAFKVPKDIKKVEDKVDLLQLHIREIELKLNQINKKIDK